MGHLIDHLREQYADIQAVLSHLDAVERDIVLHVNDFLPQGEAAGGAAGLPGLARPSAALRRYQVNLLVDNGDCNGAPVVQESLPNHGNLIGTIEHVSQLGTLRSSSDSRKTGIQLTCATLRFDGDWLPAKPQPKSTASC